MTKKNKFKFNYKFKPTHFLVFALIIFLGSLWLTLKGYSVENLKQLINIKNPININKDKQKIEISGVKVANFIDQNNDSSAPSFYTIAKNADFHIFYLPADELFFISVTSYPFDKIVRVAEQQFLDSLDISQEEACRLKVDITTPSFANPDKAGEIYHLSFCQESQ